MYDAARLSVVNRKKILCHCDLLSHPIHQKTVLIGLMDDSIGR